MLRFNRAEKRAIGLTLMDFSILAGCEERTSKLSQSFQSRNMDTVSACGTNGGIDHHLRRYWQDNPYDKTWRAFCWYLYKQRQSRTLGRSK